MTRGAEFVQLFPQLLRRVAVHRGHFALPAKGLYAALARQNGVAQPRDGHAGAVAMGQFKDPGVRDAEARAPAGGLAFVHGGTGALHGIAQQRDLRQREIGRQHLERHVGIVLRLVHQQVEHALVRRGKAQLHAHIGLRHRVLPPDHALLHVFPQSVLQGTGRQTHGRTQQGIALDVQHVFQLQTHGLQALGDGQFFRQFQRFAFFENDRSVEDGRQVREAMIRPMVEHPASRRLEDLQTDALAGLRIRVVDPSALAFDDVDLLARAARRRDRERLRAASYGDAAGGCTQGLYARAY